MRGGDVVKFLLLKKKVYLFINFWLCWVFVAVWASL